MCVLMFTKVDADSASNNLDLATDFKREHPMFDP